MGQITPNDYHYVKEDGVYKLMSGSTVISAGLKVAVACAIHLEPTGRVTVIRHKFGPPTEVRQWFAVSSKRYRDMGLDDFADELCIVESDRWTVEELDNIIHLEGYLGRIFERLGIRYSDFFASNGLTTG